jgi:hypothetical protein
VYEGIDTIVLFEELAYEDVVPVRWRALKTPANDVIRRSCAERNLKLLQTAAALEEHGQAEKPDESPYHADIVRLDMKLNLLLDLVGQILVVNQPRPEPMQIRFNAVGAVWQHKGPMPVEQASGVLEIYLRECIVDPLRMIGTIASVGADGRIKVTFDPPSKAVKDLIEKLAFRRHRRQIAGARHPHRDTQ